LNRVLRWVALLFCGCATVGLDPDVQRIEQAMAPEQFSDKTPGAQGIAMVPSPRIRIRNDRSVPATPDAFWAGRGSRVNTLWQLGSEPLVNQMTRDLHGDLTSASAGESLAAQMTRSIDEDFRRNGVTRIGRVGRGSARLP
jgi:hypothetical protein